MTRPACRWLGTPMVVLGYDPRPTDRDNVNLMTVQPFVNYNFERGWYVSSGPIITATWAAHGNDNTWTVPVGGGFDRFIRIGKLPVNLSAQAFEWSSPPMTPAPTGPCACRSSSCSRNDAAACYVGGTVRKET